MEWWERVTREIYRRKRCKWLGRKRREVMGGGEGSGGEGRGREVKGGEERK